MEYFHEESLRKHHIHVESLGAEPISFDEMRARYVSMGDSDAPSRLAWLSEVFLSLEKKPYISGDLRYLSAAQSGFDVLLIGGNDTRRIASLVRRNFPILGNKLLIALTRGSTPQRRAQLLNSGYDDVFDIDRTVPIEAIARLKAMRARQISVQLRDRAAQTRNVRLAMVCKDVLSLSPRQRQILSLLIERPGTPISLPRLQTECSRTHEPISRKNVQVVVCQIRRKLRCAFKIVHEDGRGYAIESAIRNQTPESLLGQAVT